MSSYSLRFMYASEEMIPRLVNFEKWKKKLTTFAFHNFKTECCVYILDHQRELWDDWSQGAGAWRREHRCEW